MGGLIHLAMDGIDTGASTIVLSDSSTGSWSIAYTLPLDTTPGNHNVSASFLGGFLWVDPMGEGDSVNPEFYLGSISSLEFDVSVPTEVRLFGGDTEVAREDLLSLVGVLFDVAERPVPNQNLTVWMNGQFLTNVTTDAEGCLLYTSPSPRDATLSRMPSSA